MDPDDAADLLAELPPEQAEELLALMEPEDAEDLRRLLTYDDYTAGGMMTTEPIDPAARRHRRRGARPRSATPTSRRRSPRRSTSCAPPLETPTGKLPRRRHFQRLLREPPSTLVAAVLDADLEPIGPDAPLAQVTRYFATYNLVALPVVDENDHLLGAVTVDDVIDHMLPEDWRDPTTTRTTRPRRRGVARWRVTATPPGPRLDQPTERGAARCGPSVDPERVRPPLRAHRPLPRVVARSSAR